MTAKAAAERAELQRREAELRALRRTQSVAERIYPNLKRSEVVRPQRRK